MAQAGRTIIAVILIGIWGCAPAGERISLEYIPFAQDRPIDPNAMRVQVDADDLRSAVGPKVSASINRLGIETRPIESDRPVADYVADALEAEFAARGFTLDEGGALVEVDVETFYNNFRRGVDQGTAMGRVAFRVHVRGGSGTTYYTNVYQGLSERPMRLANGANAKSALELAFYDAVSKLATDWRFFGAVVDAATEEAQNTLQ